MNKMFTNLQLVVDGKRKAMLTGKPTRKEELKLFNKIIEENNLFVTPRKNSVFISKEKINEEDLTNALVVSKILGYYKMDPKWNKLDEDRVALKFYKGKENFMTQMYNKKNLDFWDLMSYANKEVEKFGKDFTYAIFQSPAVRKKDKTIKERYVKNLGQLQQKFLVNEGIPYLTDDNGEFVKRYDTDVSLDEVKREVDEGMVFYFAKENKDELQIMKKDDDYFVTVTENK